MAATRPAAGPGREAFQEAGAPRAPAIPGDVPNDTDIQPIIQLGAVKL